jgi:biotin operon repressor
MSKGWVKIHRQIINWEWYDEPNTFRLFFHLLLKANHKPRKYRGVTIKEGQVMTGQEVLAKELGLTRSKIRLSLDNLKTTNEITIKSSRQGTIIEVVKYKDYQITTNETTTEPPEDNHETTSNKNVNNEKELLLEKFKHWAVDSDLDIIKVEDTFLNAWDYYTDLDWKDKNNKQVKDKQRKIRTVWFKDLSKFKKDLKIDKLVLNCAIGNPLLMAQLCEKHKVTEQYIKELHASKTK